MQPTVINLPNNIDACPNCGSNNITLSEMHEYDGYGKITCDDCGCSTGFMATEAAIRVWSSGAACFWDKASRYLMNLADEIECGKIRQIYGDKDIEIIVERIRNIANSARS